MKKIWLFCLCFTVLSCFVINSLFLNDSNNEQIISLQEIRVNDNFSQKENIFIENFDTAYALDNKNGDLFISNNDTSNGQNQIINQTTGQTFSTDISTFPLYSISGDYGTNMFFAKYDNYGISKLNTEDESIVYFDKYIAERDSISIGRVFDITSDTNGTIYALAQNPSLETVVIYKEKEQSDFYLYCELEQSVDYDSKFDYSIDNDFFILYANNNFYKFDQSGCYSANDAENLGVATYSVTETQNVVDIKLDFYDSLFILTSDAIYRFDKNNSTSQSFESSFAECVSFDFDYRTGEILLLSPTSLQSTMILNGNENFINTINSDNYPDYADSKLEVNFLTVIQDDAPLYEFDNPLYNVKLDDKNVTLNTGLILYSIGEKTSTGYYFVMIANLQGENVFGYVKENCVNQTTLTSINSQARILLDNTSVFNYPSSLDDSMLATKENTPLTLSKNSIVQVLDAMPYADSNGITFARIEHEGEIYFVNNYALSSIISQSAQPIKTSLTKEEITIYADMDMQNEITNIPKDEFVEVLSESDGTSLIRWNSYVGYVDSELLNDNLFSNLVFIGFVLLVVAIILAICVLCIVLHFKNKKRIDQN